MAATSLPDIPEIGLVFPRSPLAEAAFKYSEKHCAPLVHNHTVRSAYWALILAKKLPHVYGNPDLELVTLSCMLHDLGWASTKELLSAHKRFEVDGADLARDWLRSKLDNLTPAKEWSEDRLQRSWYAIALHTNFTLTPYTEPDVSLTSMAIGADFYGPKYAPIVAPESNVITVEEYHAVMKRFPRAGFDYNGFKGVMCDICREKPATTYDNFVGEFGRKWGPNGDGVGKEEFDKAMSDAVFASEAERSIGYLVELDKSVGSE
ncbi:metal dependent phosphohydrolase [Trichoderma citrinoviride]|uniref:Metal dependent phosphohydrolase n=1 Tax=Trichoderma citrinoviride TaxID=58853 RepID=A0A2T4BGH4_9HYPO|nr:metal dependent phosphohydrolase [Trichoderma citrinoviride]PTB68415.1 metal dependent phosphohydrolase [Trichoderma citrinoviride]